MNYKVAAVAVFVLDGLLLFAQKEAASSTILLQPVSDVSPSVEITFEPPLETPSPMIEPEPTTEPSIDPTPTETVSPYPTITFEPVPYPAPETWTDWLSENLETINNINNGLVMDNTDTIVSAAYRGWQYGLELTTPLDETSKALLAAYMYDVETVVEEWGYRDYNAATTRFNKAIDEWNSFLQYVTNA